MTEPLLRVRDLVVEFGREPRLSRPVDGVGFDVGEREIVGIVGESGSGKSLTLLALLGLLPSGGRVVTGDISFSGRDLSGADPAMMRSLRGREIALIPSDAGAALNPVSRVGRQLQLSLRTRRPELPAGERRERVMSALSRVRLPRPKQVMSAYPHELSGGMQQRSAIAMGVQNEPTLLLADEPTTALDVSIQAEILKLLVQLRDELGTAIVFVTHDISTVREICDRVVVMYAGQVVEQGRVEQILTQPRHPYTAALIGSIPPLGGVPPEALETVAGMPPEASDWPDGCRFRARCRHYTELGEPDRCATEMPGQAGGGTGSADSPARLAACHFPLGADSENSADVEMSR